MRLKAVRSRQIVLIFACGVLLAGFVAAQTFPLVRSSLQRGDAARGANAATTAPDAPTQKQWKQRDMSKYADGGQFTVAVGSSPSSREAVMARVRGFLLEHWRGRRLGRVVTHFPNAEGRLSPSAFYVETDEGGAWGITLESAHGAERFAFVGEVEAPPGDGPPVLGATGRGGAIKLHLKADAGANSGLVL